MRCSVMFIRVKTSRKEEGMIEVTAQTQEPELIAAARVNACVGFISAQNGSVRIRVPLHP